MIFMSQPTSLVELLNSLKTGDRSTERLLYLYVKTNCYPKVAAYLSNRGAQRADAEDLFQDAVLVFFEAVRSGKFQYGGFRLKPVTSKVNAYLMGVSKNLWKKELRWRNRKPLPQEEQTVQMEVEIAGGIAADAYSALGDECQELLSLYFRQKLSPTKIGGRLGRKTAEVKKQLAHCTDKMLETLGRLFGEEQQGVLSELISQGIEGLEERCRALLTAFYFERKSMTEIAQAYGYASAHSATEQKSRCMKRLNTVIVSKVLNS